MSPFGLMMLIHPAILCLIIGTALVVTGLTWFFMLHRYPIKHPKRLCFAIFLASVILYVLIIYFAYGILPIRFEFIRPLES